MISDYWFVYNYFWSPADEFSICFVVFLIFGLERYCDCKNLFNIFATETVGHRDSQTQGQSDSETIRQTQ